MTIKKKSPTTLAGDTGNNFKSKLTKKPRIKHYKLAYTWGNSSNISVLKGPSLGK